MNFLEQHTRIENLLRRSKNCEPNDAGYEEARALLIEAAMLKKGVVNLQKLDDLELQGLQVKAINRFYNQVLTRISRLNKTNG